MVAPGVGDEEEPWLPEGSLDPIGESARASDGGAADVSVANFISTDAFHSIIKIERSVTEIASSVDQTAFPKSGSSYCHEPIQCESLLIYLANLRTPCWA